MDKQAREAREMAKNLPWREKIPYIWQYYKWWIVGGLALILAVGGTVYEVQTRPSYDLEIAYYSEKYVPEQQIQDMEAYFAQYVEDVDGDGTKSVKIYSTSVSMMGGSAEGEAAVQTRLMAELSAGTYPVFLFDQAFYQMAQGGSLGGSMETFRNLAQAPGADALGITQDAPVYWGTRTVYQREQKKEARQAEYQRIRAMEEAICGQRSD